MPDGPAAATPRPAAREEGRDDGRMSTPRTVEPSGAELTALGAGPGREAGSVPLEAERSRVCDGSDS